MVAILIVDDSADDRFAFRRMLSKLTSYEILEASSGPEALELIDRVQCVLLDYWLGGQTGLDVLRKIMDRPLPPPVIMITGERDVEISVRALKEGATDYLVKGHLDAKILENAIRNTLGRDALAKQVHDQQKRLSAFYALIDQTQDALLVIDATTREIIEANAMARRLISIEYNLVSIVLEQLHGQALVRFEQELASTPTDIRVQLVNTENRLFAIAVLRDISEQRNLEKQLRAERDQLAEFSAFKSRFLATMSHEIRTPLNAMIGLTSVLQVLDLNTDLRETVTIIHNSGQHLLSVVNNILDFSKIEANAIELEYLPFSPVNCVKAAVDLMELQAKTKGLSLTLEVTGDSPGSVIGDENRMRQIVVNLISNAIKFTESGGVTVRISRQDENLIFSVADTGIGIATDKIDLIFTEFKQADASTARRFGGTGLGLSITQRLVALMHGSIAVYSHPGRGSEFRVELPLEFLEGDSKKFDRSLEDAYRTTLKFEILLVEDNHFNQLVGIRILETLGHSVDVVSNGELALTALERRSYDVVLMDTEMEVMDGHTATREICQRYLKPERPWIIGVSASAFAEDRAACLSAGANDFLPKPVSIDSLRKALQAVPPRQIEHRRS